MKNLACFLKKHLLLLAFLITIASCSTTKESTNTPLPMGEFKYETIDTKIIADEMPEFPGGQSALYKFLGQHLRYPTEAQKSKTQGRVFVNFIIKADGSIVNIKIMRGVEESLDKEAMRVVSLMPKWKPGYTNGKAVNTMFTIPVNFTLK